MAMFVRALAWVSEGGDEETYWAENQAALVSVQRTDENEVRVGASVGDSSHDDVSLYLTVSEAGRLAHLLGVAVLANEAAAHEAASL